MLTVQYDVYENDVLLNYNQEDYDEKSRMRDLQGLSNTINTINDFKGSTEGNAYLRIEERN